MSTEVSSATEQSEESLCIRFREFIKTHRPAMVSRHLRCVLLDYISEQYEMGFPLDFDVWIAEFYDLFELLDEAEDERVTVIS